MIPELAVRLVQNICVQLRGEQPVLLPAGKRGQLAQQQPPSPGWVLTVFRVGRRQSRRRLRVWLLPGEMAPAAAAGGAA